MLNDFQKHPPRVLQSYYEADACLVQMGQEESKMYCGAEPLLIGVPFTKEQVDWLFQNMNAWAIAFAQCPGVIDDHYPKDKRLQFVNTHALIVPKIMRQTPIPRVQVIFTDGCSNGTAACVIQSKAHNIFTPSASDQVLELRAVAAIFQKMDIYPFNLYTDNQYISRALQVLEMVLTVIQ